MKKTIYFFLTALFLFNICLPSSIVFADDSGYTDSQLADIGTLMLTNLIASGEASELDFSDYTENEGLDFLISLGELAVTGDPTGLIDQGLTWLGGELSDTYDSLIESIREWEYSIAPDLYNWWYQGTQYEYKLQPASNISRPLTKLLKHPESEQPIIPSQPSNIQILLDFINKRDNTNANSFFFYNAVGVQGDTLVTAPPSDYSWVVTFSLSGLPNYFVGYTKNTPLIMPLPIQNLYIYNNNGVYSFNHSFSSQYLKVMTWGGAYSSVCRYVESDSGLVGVGLSDRPSGTYTSSGTLEQVLNYIKDRYKNVNIYVDNSPISLVNYSAPTYPIVIPGTLTVLNEQPVVYDFPTPTFYDINDLKTLITNAINNSDVITWQDIDDYFLDINGQQALPVVQIYRNDYDNMYIEQYPYPAKLIGMQEPLTFNEHLLDNYYGQYLTPMVDVVANTVDVIPGELKWVLGIGAILMIFAVIINRLLE